MIRINLLPVRAAKRREAVQRHIVLFAAGLVAIIAVGLIFFQQEKSVLDGIAGQNNALTQEIEDLKKVIGEVDQYKEEQQKLEQKLDVIDELRDKKTGPVRMLDRIASDIPDKLWLTELEEVEAKVTLKGVSINNEVIATFMTRLEESKLFSEVYLVSIERESIDDLNFKRFTITSKLHVAQTEPDAAEGTGG